MTKQEEIKQLKKEKNAVILAHYYVEDEIQEVADYVGDSFYLSKIAAGLSERVLIFCGVFFMGESGKLLSPDKEVLMPDASADCPMAHMVMKEEVERARREYENLAVVCYINSTAEIKSWSDICVTSANALEIVRKLPNYNILFIPDKNLGHYIAKQVPEKNIMLVNGFCPVHEMISAEEIKELKKSHPEAKVLVHPECNERILDLADYIGSTTAIIHYASESSKEEFIIATEIGVLCELQKRNPEKKFYFPKTRPVCPDMKKITLDQIIRTLKTGCYAVNTKEPLRNMAGRTLERMLELS